MACDVAAVPPCARACHQPPGDEGHSDSNYSGRMDETIALPTERALLLGCRFPSLFVQRSPRCAVKLHQAVCST
eukprot:3263878-Amphidinium_carterae.1